MPESGAPHGGPAGAHASSDGAPAAPSTWLTRFAHLIPPGSSVLDVACGRGRHSLWLAARGHPVVAVDQDAEALAGLRGQPGITTVQADLENDPWPFAAGSFGAVVVTNYLWRPLFAPWRAALAPEGVLLIETFARGQEGIGRPRNPAFLLEPGELLAQASTLRVVAYEDGFLTAPDRFVQRMVAVRGAAVPRRLALKPPAAGAPGPGR